MNMPPGVLPLIIAACLLFSPMIADKLEDNYNRSVNIGGSNITTAPVKLGFGSTSEINETIVNEDIIKTPMDKKTYRGFVLKNGLQIMVVSDPKSSTSAASLSVATGWLINSVLQACVLVQNE